MSAFGLVNTVFNYWGHQSPRVTTVNLASPAIGCRFVSVVAGGTEQMPNVAQTGAGADAKGVLDGDGVAGDKRAVWSESEGITVTAGAALTAGQAVESDAEGRAVPHTTGAKLGVANTDAALNEPANIKLAL